VENMGHFLDLVIVSNYSKENFRYLEHIFVGKATWILEHVGIYANGSD
jgi:hypothetical protein